MKRVLTILAACGALAAAAHAQEAPKDKVLTGKDVTEKNITDALEPKPEDTAGIRTRTLRIGPGVGGAAAGAAAAGASSATSAAGSSTAAPTGGAAAPAAAGAAAPSAAGAERPSASLLITFRTNSADLTESARGQLDVLARALKGDKLKPFNFMLEGHADPRGNPAANLALSQARAESVRGYLVAQHGIEAARLRAVGKGDRELKNTRDPAAPENRRVTIVTQVN